MKPSIICYMMSSIDGRIDCKMTEQLDGVEEYDKILNDLNLKTTVTGRVTAETEMALPGKFEPKNPDVHGEAGFRKNRSAEGYNIVLDTNGILQWPEVKEDEKQSLLIITSEKVTKEYLDYLDERHISWIVAGKKSINLTDAMEVLSKEFGVERVGVVGGPTINTAFLEEGLLDEVVLLIGPGIDGRSGMQGVFEGRKSETPAQLALEEVKSYPDGAVLLKYHI